MKYARTKTGCKAWSVGHDGRDNGGAYGKGSRRGKRDIVFELTK
jgi:hypothetical protein